MRRIPIALPLLLAACVSDFMTAEQLAPDRWRISYDEPVANASSAASIMDWHAPKYCPNGYEKIADRRVGSAYVWDIRCLPAAAAPARPPAAP